MIKIIVLLFSSALIGWGNFPPAPPAVIYGNVKDDTGMIFDHADTIIVVFADGIEIGRSPLKRHPSRNENYRIPIPVLTPTPSYSVGFIRGGVEGSLIEMNGALATYQPTVAGVTRLDFVVGEDRDLDGLSDAWEEYQLSFIDGGSDLGALDREGDFDYDGLSNYEELIAGTIATQFSSQVNFVVHQELEGGWVSMSLDVVKGRVYQLLASTDGAYFEPVEIAVDDRRESTVMSYASSVNSRLTVSTPPIEGGGVFYRVAVR